MSVPEVHVVGTRSFAAEAADFAAEAGFRVVGLLEPYDRDRVGTTIHGLPVAWLDGADPGLAVLGTGEHSRRAIVERLLAGGWTIASVVHPDAHVSPRSTVGSGSVLAPGVVVGAYATIGDYAVLGRGALVGHHTSIGPYATLCPGANVAGNVRIGTEVLVGMGALIRDHLVVGDGATVAMGAVVVADVDPGLNVRGFPASMYEPIESADREARDEGAAVHRDS